MKNNTQRKIKMPIFIDYYIINICLVQIYHELTELSKHADFCQKTISDSISKNADSNDIILTWEELRLDIAEKKCINILKKIELIKDSSKTMKQEYENEFDKERNKFVDKCIDLYIINNKNYYKDQYITDNDLFKFKLYNFNEKYNKMFSDLYNLNIKDYKKELEELKKECACLTVLNIYTRNNMTDSCQDVIKDNIDMDIKILTLNNEKK